ncbi:unnamed protein product [Ilex paraguariensis]|uniref:CW-type domain-containing protein n=1 Tax=Ilex paraguariensis TaxID=185542 RepID=A0ABC8RBY6_9AQUA
MTYRMTCDVEQSMPGRRQWKLGVWEYGVTFSRVEPEGKLVMGCRKASNAPSSDQGNETVNTGNGVVSTRRDVSIANAADQASTLSKVDKSGYIAREVLEAKPSSRKKRKNSTLGSKSKRPRVENEDRMELNLTWEQAQGLLRPPPDRAPTIVVIEGFEFEEYEDAPVIGRPTIPAADNMGEEIQWAQCEDCFKWRKVPANALLPLKWTCSRNSWDPDRSLCLAAQELTSEHLQDLLDTSNKAASKKMKAAKQDPDSAGAMEGLDKLADLAIQEEGESLPSSSQATTKHPRHRPGCTCIVCIQPPSGKGHKHKQSCDCNVCATVKRRFHTLLLRREKKQSEKEAETERQKLQQQLLPEQMLDGDVQQCGDAGNTSPNQEMVCHEGSENDPNMRRTSISPFKCQIDLNIQPEREEDLSPSSDSGGTMRLLQDATVTYLRQQRFSNSISNGNLVGNQTKQDGFGGGNCSSNTASGSSLQKPEANHDIITPINPLASTSTTDR